MACCVACRCCRRVPQPHDGDLLMTVFGPYVFVCFGAAAITAIAAIQGHRSPQSMESRDGFLRSQWRIHRSAMFLFGGVSILAALLAVGSAVAGSIAG